MYCTSSGSSLVFGLWSLHFCVLVLFFRIRVAQPQDDTSVLSLSSHPEAVALRQYKYLGFSTMHYPYEAAGSDALAASARLRFFCFFALVARRRRSSLTSAEVYSGCCSSAGTRCTSKPRDRAAVSKAPAPLTRAVPLRRAAHLPPARRRPGPTGAAALRCSLRCSLRCA